MLVSIVTTLYKSENYLEEFVRRIHSSVESITQDYEIIFVNDGSPDQSLTKILALKQTISQIKVIDLSRNFGHHEAGLVGLEHAQGDYIFLIDSDLEEAPELLLNFWQELQQHPDLDVVYGVQIKRKGNWFEQLSGSIFYRIFNHLSEIEIPRNLLTIRLMKKSFVQAVLQYPERNVFLAGLMALAGFNQQALPVHKLSNPTGTYTLSRQLRLFSTCITAFSTKPLEYIFLSGVLITLFAFLVGLYYGINHLFALDQTQGDSLLLIVVSGFLSGIIIMCTGILGIYQAKIYQEVKQRPRTFIKKIY